MDVCVNVQEHVARYEDSEMAQMFLRSAEEAWQGSGADK